MNKRSYTIGYKNRSTNKKRGSEIMLKPIYEDNDDGDEDEIKDEN